MTRLETYWEIEDLSPHKIILPSNIIYNIRKSDGKKSNFTVNMNSYRQHGACFFVMNKVKQLFHEQVKEQIEKLPQLKYPIRCKYTVYTKTKRLFDVNNICAVADKYFMDAVVEYGKLPDDNYNYYLGFKDTNFGGVDKNFPRIEVEIYENCK